MSNRSSWDVAIRARIESLYAKGGWRQIPGSDFVMEPGDAIVMEELDVMTESGRFRLAATKAAARPPFEWLYEITSEINTGGGIRHYLVREDDIVAAERRTLTPLETADGELILSDFDAVEAVA
ncbi:MAG: hypothetical protein ABIS59_02570 [Candidatus Saccharibacteria bacterium]